MEGMDSESYKEEQRIDPVMRFLKANNTLKAMLGESKLNAPSNQGKNLNLYLQHQIQEENMQDI